jgi:hypothetical protein
VCVDGLCSWRSQAQLRSYIKTQADPQQDFDEVGAFVVGKGLVVMIEYSMNDTTKKANIFFREQSTTPGPRCPLLDGSSISALLCNLSPEEALPPVHA